MKKGIRNSFFIVLAIGIAIVIVVDSAKWKNVVEEFVGYVSDKRNVKIEFREYVSVGCIKCICTDEHGKSLIYEKEYEYKEGGKGTMMRVAKDIYAELPQDKYEIIFSDYNVITIKESLEYQLANQISYSNVNSDDTLLQERLRDIVPKHRFFLMLLIN